MGERAILEQIFRRNPALDDSVVIPPGDDMGAMRLGDRLLLVTVDPVAEGVHFVWPDHGPAAVAQKAIGRNLSDVAAMAARPLGAVASAMLPEDWADEQAAELFEHLAAAADRWSCPLVGGDVGHWSGGLLLTVTVFATVDPGEVPVCRNGASAGDQVFVTGALGGSGETVGDGPPGHLAVEPRLAEARKLAHDSGMTVSAMIDLSDGLARDLGHIAEQSALAARVEAAKLPISPACEQAAAASGRPTWEHAIGDGEDYELCFTVPASDAGRVPDEVDGAPITWIGEMVEHEDDRPRVTLRLPDGEEVDVDGRGWEHGA